MNKSISNNEFDTVVLGSGPGGYVAAIRAAQLGQKTAVIERSELGGICLNWGCIPTKALLRASEVLHTLQTAQEYGISCDNISFDIQKIVARSRDVSSKLNQGVTALLKANNVTVLKGHGKLISKNTIALHQYENKKTHAKISEVLAKNIILATGARPRMLPNLQIDNVRVLDYMAAMTPKSLPKSLLVVGAGAIGVEFATFYASLGSQVSIIEVSDRILSTEDEEISQMAQTFFEKQGIKIYTNAKLKDYSTLQSAIIDVNGKDISVDCEKIISAVGVVPNTEDIGLEHTKIQTTPQGNIMVNEYGETAEPGIYAIGDITQPPFLAHKASHEGIICAENIAATTNNSAQSKQKLPSKNDIPGCIYSHPEIASIGLTEKQAKLLGTEITVGKFSLLGNGKAIAFGDQAAAGMIKTIYDKQTGEILGAHLIGHHVTEMIHSIAIAKKAELTEQDIIHSIFPHPTISEALHESALSALMRQIHMPPVKK